MTFNYDDEESTIRHFIYDEGLYYIDYLDGSTSKYHADINHCKELEKIMINQAKERDKKYYDNYKKNKLYETASFVTTVLFFIQTNNIAYKNMTLLLCIGIILSLLSLCTTVKIKYESKEIKKYHDFLSIVEKVKDKNSKIIVDFEKNNGHTLDINNLDLYTNVEIKQLMKKLG